MFPEKVVDVPDLPTKYRYIDVDAYEPEYPEELMEKDAFNDIFSIGFSEYQWRFVGNKPQVNDLETLADYPAVTEVSTLFAKDLKKRGFKFLGPTTVYAYMQACGMVNDHSNDCFRKTEIIASYRR